MKTIINFANKVKSLVDGRISNIANVEESPSTHAYAVGKQLIFNGLLCKATSAISVGDTLAVGTNLALSYNVVEQIYSLNQGLTNSLNEIADMNNVLGAKNLLPNNSESWTYGGITFTVNSDGSVTANGTASETVWLLVSDNIKLDNIAYTLTGCPEGGGGGIYEIHIRSTESDSSQWQFFIDIGNGITFTGDPNRNYVCYISVAIGKTVSNLTFYPMLRLASIQDDTYVPYSMTNREMTPYVQSISNPNLLDNPWFTVNQREFTTTASSWVYVADRWMTGNVVTGSVTKESDGTLTIIGNSQIKELIEESRMEVGKTYTYSVMLYDNSIISETFVLPARTSSSWQQIVNKSINSIRIFGAYNSGCLSFWIEVEGSATKRIKGAKLELGSVSTLSMDSAPNYISELLKCQRYFVRFSPTDSYTAFGAGIYSSNNVFAEVTLPTVLRAKPNVYYSTIRAHSYGRNDVNISSIIVNNYVNNIVSLKCAPGSGANFVNGDYCEIQLDVNNFLDLSCDL